MLDSAPGKTLPVCPSGTAILRALVRAKKKFGPILKKARGNYGKYPNLEGVLEAIDPALEEEGLFLSQSEQREGYLTTEVSHAESGEAKCGHVRLILEKNTPQGGGSALTYSRRYGILAFFGLAAEDDDGQRAEEERRPSASPRPAAVAQNPLHSAFESAKPAPLGSPDYVIPIGKMLKGLKLAQVDPDQLEGFVRWLKTEADKKKEPLSGVAKQFVENASVYLEGL
jgi:hypothetical protein